MQRIEVNVVTGERTIVDLTPREEAEALQRTALEQTELAQREALAALERKRADALKALDDARLAIAALDPLAPQEVKAYAEVLKAG